MLKAAAIMFEPDGYVLSGPKLMGRQAAGNAFLRAAVLGRGNAPVACVTPSRQSAEVFARLVKSIDPTADPKWIPSGNLEGLKSAGTLYLPGPSLLEEAFIRLRAGPGAYSIVGVTHTTASKAAMEAIASLIRAPVMPWDALICTSNAVAKTVEAVIDAETDYLRWRLNNEVAVDRPQLPVIPLGVHCEDFNIVPAQRAASRKSLNIGDDEVVALFVGRLSFHAKAHPYAMYVALEQAARRTGKKIVLVQCGWFANSSIEAAFKDGASQYAPSVRAIFNDGRNATAREQSWAAADFFVSLSDNIQETFGLSPVEAMAAGLPVVVTDWDGYKDTVRDGVDGFRIPTCAPSARVNEPAARGFESGQFNYDQYCALTCRTVSVDLSALIDRCAALIEQPGLRKRLGDAGRERARNTLDWRFIYKRYCELYRELASIRKNAKPNASQFPVPLSSPAHMDPAVTFGHYPTAQITTSTRVVTRTAADNASFKALARDPLFGFLPEMLPVDSAVDRILKRASHEPVTVSAIAQDLSCPASEAIYAVAVLSKMGLITIIAS